MTVRIGLVGLGFMGKCHYDAYAGLRGVQVAAICDVDKKKRDGDWSSIAGNIGGAGRQVDLKGVQTYADLETMLAEEALDAVDIALPTHLHAAAALTAFKAGRHVICEKPMARTSREAGRMMAAAQKAGRQLYTAQCIRFWPSYVKAREVIESRRYGTVITAAFRRLSPTPVWSWKGWLMDSDKSGDAALDLHIHDADFVLQCFGKPKAVVSRAAGFRAGRLDHIQTLYEYGANQLVTAEGAWEYRGAGYPFEMSFNISLEKADLRLAPDGTLTLHPHRGKEKRVPLKATDGYTEELRHFVACIRQGKASDRVSPLSARRSLQLVEAEVRAARTGKRVAVKW